MTADQAKKRLHQRVRAVAGFTPDEDAPPVVMDERTPGQVIRLILGGDVPLEEVDGVVENTGAAATNVGNDLVARILSDVEIAGDGEGGYALTMSADAMWRVYASLHTAFAQHLLSGIFLEREETA